VYVPVGIITLLRHPPTASALGYAASAGILSSAVPFLADLLALRRVPARFFGVFMSVNPVLAALVGLLILDQSLGWAEWLAITTIVIANTVSVLTADRRRPRPLSAGSCAPGYCGSDGSHGRWASARQPGHSLGHSSCRNSAGQDRTQQTRPLT
jgi:inner membrane transporter RhtA